MITGLGQGGAETQIVGLAKHLRSIDWNVEIISLLTPSRFLTELASQDIPVWSPGMLKRGWNFLPLFKIWKHLRTRRPDLLCTFMFHANVTGRIVGRLARVPVIVSSIRNERFGARWREWLETRTQRLADAIVVNSKTVAQSLRQRGILSGQQIRVIPNWVDFGRFSVELDRATIRRRLGIGGQQFIWLAVGRLEPQKDYELLLRSIARLKGEVGDFCLLIAGMGPLHMRLQDLLAAQDLNRHVSLLGLRDDVPELMHAADALVLASRWEGSPNVVLEALASGLPVVATDVGGVSEMIENKVSGIVIPPGDASRLAEAMKEMMDLSRARRQSMAVSGRQRVADLHGADNTLAKWVRLFQELLEQRTSNTAVKREK
jgi:glycosyltransferase involved in cell wall biosynthesis